MKQDITQISELLKSIYHFDISKYDEIFLNKTIEKRISENQFKSNNDYISYLEHNKIEADKLLKSLQNSYSEFFRNTLTFAVLERIILHTLINRKNVSHKKEIRIWSAACASGQEVYSLAMILDELLTGIDSNINYRIFATDKNEFQIDAAIKGIYSADLLGNLSMKRINKWFLHDSNSYSVKPELKEKIDFSVFELLSDKFTSPPSSIFGDFDIVFCANLLFYYTPEYRFQILKKIRGSIHKDGYIVCGETERDILLLYNFKEVFPYSAIFQY